MSDDIDIELRADACHPACSEIYAKYDRHAPECRADEILWAADEIERLLDELATTRAACPNPLIEGKVIQAFEGVLAINVEGDDAHEDLSFFELGDKVSVFPWDHGPLSEAEAERVTEELDAMRAVAKRLHDGWKPRLDQGTGEWFWERLGDNGEDMSGAERRALDELERAVDSEEADDGE